MNLSPRFDAHLSRYSPQSVMAPHIHREPGFCVILEGVYEETILRGSHKHGVGHMLFCPADVPHSQRFGPTGTLQVLFDADPMSLDYMSQSGVVLDSAPHVSSAEVLAIAPRLARELSLNDRHSHLATAGLILELMAIFARSPLAQRDRQTPLWLRRVREALDDDSRALPRLSDLAKEAGRHPVHLARVFRAHFGETIGAYARRRQAEHAANLLRTSRIPLTEIAFECGYAGSAQFSRGFKAVFGMTPSQYRDRR